MRFLFFILLLSFAGLGYAQRFEATYKVEKDITVELDNGTNRKVATLEYAGHLYRLDNRYMFFKKPLYLQQYPSGSVQARLSETNTHEFALPMDTVQGISYKAMDSLLFRYRFDMSGKDKVKNNYVQAFEPGFQQWQFLPDTKEINGLKVQKAVLNNKASGEPIWEVWFCADIPMEAGPSNIVGLPGLMVEGISFPFKEKYSLQSYAGNSNFPDHVFWPGEFGQPFVTRPPVKRKM